MANLQEIIGLTRAQFDTLYENGTITINGETLNYSEDVLYLVETADGEGSYILPQANNTTLGGIKTGYTTSGKNYKVQVDSSGNAYVNVPWSDSNTDTKNTAGATNSTSKLYLIGATSQEANPQTYSRSTAYVGTDGKLYSGGKVVYASGDSFPEAYLSWGGRNSVGSFAPIDAAMIPALGANRLAFMPANGVTVEYSQDGGATWLAYSTTDEAKINLFNGNSATYYIGGSSATKIDKSKYMLRITIETATASVYTALNKFAIYVSTNGSTGSYCTITGRTQANYSAGTDTWTTFVDKQSVSGWSGWNIINTNITTYGNQTSHYRQVRFTFGVTSHANTVTYAGLTVYKILGFGGVGWTTPSTFAATGNMYTYDYLKNVTFPAAVKATSFIENGTALSDKYQAKGNYLTGITKAQVTTALGYTPPTTNDISTAISNLVDSSPDALNTLNELAAALGDDPNFATTVATQIGGKLGKTEKAASATVADSVAWANVTGKPSSYYTLPTRLNEYSTSGYSNADDATPQGWHYMSSSSTNRPPFKQVDGMTSGDYRIMTTAYSNIWLQQIATDFRSNDIFTRRKQNGTWYGWTALVKMQQGLASPVGTNNAIVRWDSSRNATIKDSKVTIDDNGVLNAKTLQENGTALSSKYQPKIVIERYW